VRVVLDLLTVKFLSSYSTRPLQMFGGVGITLGLLGFIACAWVTYQRFFGYESANRPLFFAGIMLVLGAVQLLMTGLLAEMLSRTYHESQDKPIYVIREVRETPSRSHELIEA
jgi:H+/Cl- antiporter ClcA